MKTLNQVMITIAVTAAAIPTMATAQVRTDEIQCNAGAQTQMQAVALASPRQGFMTDFSKSGGHLDALPLLEGTFVVPPSGARGVCVTLTFSAQINPSDNYGVYQASIDDNPMVGHGTLTDLFPAYTAPIVFDATNQGTLLPGSQTPNVANSHMVSYTFFAVVAPGTHVMRIRMATCCTPQPPNDPSIGGVGGISVRAATAVLRW